MRLSVLTLKELWQRKSQLVSGLLAITLGIGVIVGIRTITEVSEKAVAFNLDNLGANILILPQGASVDNYYSANIDAPTFPESYVEKLVLTGILPKSEIASKPIWQSGGLVGNSVKASCAPSGPKKYADEKLQRKGIDTLAANDCFDGNLFCFFVPPEKRRKKPSHTLHTLAKPHEPTLKPKLCQRAQLSNA